MSLFGQKQSSKDEKKGVLIFLVEDNQMYARMLQHYLQKNLPGGSEVRIFPVGETAVMSLDKGKPDFIIMDYFLDTKWTDAQNGLDVAKEIRATNKDTHILLLSAQKDLQVVIDAMNVEKCSYLEKNDQAQDKVLAHIKTSLGIN